MIITIVTNDDNKNKNVFSSYLLKSYDVWHYRLGRVNYNYIQRLIKYELLPRIIFEEKKHKCKICVKSKFTKPFFK
jgi:hypothetical protein